MVGTIWTVKKYTIRYTSYGPPRRKLRIILDAIDWVYVRNGKLLPNVEVLHRSNEIASTLQLIHDARVRDDDRCLRTQPKQKEGPDNGGYTMPGGDERTDEDASLNTQMPFGTQFQHPARQRRSEDDVSFVGINRLEPVLAGNTQRAELKPRSGSAADAQREYLLSLLRKREPQQPAYPQPPVRPYAHPTPEPSRSGEHANTASPQPRETPSKRASREGTAERIAQPSQTVQNKGKKRLPETETALLSASPAKKASFSEDPPKRHHTSEDKFAAGCSWMKGLTLNRATTTVPEDQANLLNHSESWAKQSRFPPINIPISLFTVFSRTVDEKAALEGATSSGSFHDTPSSGSYPANTAPQPAEEQDSESEEEGPTSPVSWRTSPSPQPPQPPIMPRQGLPPDSSVETIEDITEATRPQKPAVEQLPPPTLPASSHAADEDLPPSSPPAQLAAVDSDDDMEISVPQALGEDLLQDSTRDYVPRTEIKSNPVVQVKETPHIKGKNGQPPAVTVCPPSQESASHSSSASIVRGTYYPELSSSAVEETRLGVLRDKDADLQAEIEGTQVISDNEAHGTTMFDIFIHDNPVPQPVLAETSEKQAEITQAAQAQPEPTPMSAQIPPKDSSSGEQPPHAATQVAMPVPVQIERQPSRQPSNTSSLTKRKHAASPTRGRRQGSRAKRPKFAFGSKDPQTLRRERQESLQIEQRKSTTSAESRQGSVNNAPTELDPDTKMELSDITAPVESPVVESSVVEALASPADGMSPRHRSLYASPSPKRRPVQAAPVTDMDIRTISLDQSQRKQLDALTDRTIDEATVNIQQEQPHECTTCQACFLDEDTLKSHVRTHTSKHTHAGHKYRNEVSRTDLPVQHPRTEDEPAGRRSTSEPGDSEAAAAKGVELLPRPENMQGSQMEALDKSVSAPVSASRSTPASVPEPSPRPSRTSGEVSVSTDQAATRALDDVDASSTIFEKFQAAYPEYKANSKHFANQCKLIDELDREDRMVPKWMWDDFIIRNRTDYARYAMDCIADGEEPTEYIRFYKDQIRDAIYKKGVIETRAALEKALQEFGVQPSATKTPATQSRVKEVAYEPVERPSRPAVHRFSDTRQARGEPTHRSPRESIQPSPRHPVYRQSYAPMLPAQQLVITPPKKKASRKSLPFATPSSAVTSGANGTAHVRHSLPASSSRITPTSTPAHTSSTHPALSTQQALGSNLGNSLRFYKSQSSASPLESGTGDEYRAFLAAYEATTVTTGSKRVRSTPASRNHKNGGSANDECNS